MTSASRKLSGGRQAAHRVDTDGERGEIRGAHRAHLRERALPARELIAPRRAPARHALGYATRTARTQDLQRELAMRAHRRVAQARAARGLPRSVDAQAIDLGVQPVESEREPRFEVG